ncbi:MAG: ankyrin repeat protein [Sphingomonadales bacterium]|nr:ankyrin repeat protein [Sphingomonadales bacterium]
MKTGMRTDSPPPLPSAERLQQLLFDAAKIGRTDMIAALVQAGGDIAGHNEDGYTPLILASYNGHLDTTTAFLEAGAAVDGADLSRGNTALMGCAFKGYAEIAAALINAGADVNRRNLAGQTALMLAAMFARDDIVDLLLAAGADANLRDIAGNIAASVAAAQQNHALSNRLIAADVGLRSSDHCRTGPE